MPRRQGTGFPQSHRSVVLCVGFPRLRVEDAARRIEGEVQVHELAPQHRLRGLLRAARDVAHGLVADAVAGLDATG